MESSSRYSLKHSDSVLNLDQASKGSPINKRSGRSTSTTSPKAVKQFPPVANLNQSKAFLLSPNTPIPRSKLRKSLPLENESPNASDSENGMLSFDSNNKRPLNKLRLSSLNDSQSPSPLQSPTSKRTSIGKLSSKFNRKQTTAPTARDAANRLLQEKKSFFTPQNYKLVKPLQTAFMSTGLLSKKRSENSSMKPKSLPPGTPCKPSFLYPSPGSSTPMTPSYRKKGGFLKSIQRSVKKEDGQESFPSKSEPFHLRSNSKEDFELPITPTRDRFSRRLYEYPGKLVYPKRTPSQDTKTEDLEIHSATLHTSRLSLQSEDFDTSLSDFGEPGRRFRNLKLLGQGEFSQVYEAEDAKTGEKFAIKRSRKYSGYKERQRRYDEVEILRQLTDYEHIVQLIDFWDHEDHLYMQMELCENGSFDLFLREIGKDSQLDEFRVWKVLIELSLGLKFVHDNGFLHLDIKPANILINFEGNLKISDFGMATKWPASKDLEREGDREYIAPEIMSSQEYEKPADVFSLGLVILETAANIELPENGLSWQKLRSGDLSDAPKLFSCDDTAFISAGTGPLSLDFSVVRPSQSAPAGSIYGNATKFNHPVIGKGHLDRIVRWMISPEPGKRPSITEVLEQPEVMWAEQARRAGAIVYEGDFGPSEELLPEGVEETDEYMEDWHVA